MELSEAAQQALEAIDRALPHAPYRSEFDVLADCADDLRAALAEPVQEPLADMAVFDLADALLYGGKNYGVLAFARAIERAHGIE